MNTNLADLYLIQIQETGNQENTAFFLEKAKGKDAEKLAAYYRFTITQLDLDASTFKEAVRKSRRNANVL